MVGAWSLLFYGEPTETGIIFNLNSEAKIFKGILKMARHLATALFETKPWDDHLSIHLLKDTVT